MIIPKTEPLETQIAKARENLSEETKAAIDAVSWKLILKGINKKYTEAQLIDLEIETELLLCGLVSTIDFPRELENRMRIPKAEVAVLLNEMDKLIFKKIQEELEKRFSGKVEEEKVLYKKKEFVGDPRFISLPKDVQEAIYYSNWKEKIYDVAKKYNINIEQTGILEEITVKTISGGIKTEQYESEIKSKIGLPDDKNKEMVVELNEKIFKAIKDLMKSNSGAEEESNQIPIPPYMKVITNDQLLITNEKITEIKKEETVIPKPEPVIVNKEESSQKEIENIISNKGLSTEETDIYRESGIEIINNDQLPINNKEVKVITNYQLPINNEKKIIEKTEERPITNILLDKLIGNTTSKTTVSDYSLPKISNQALERPHDPYHEQI